MRTAAFHTLGCKVNAYETEAMEQALLAAATTSALSRKGRMSTSSTPVP